MLKRLIRLVPVSTAWCFPIFVAVGLTGSGCAESIERIVKVTRYRDNGAGANARLPICQDQAARENLSLAKRDLYDTCILAIRKKGIRFVKGDYQPCLEVSMIVESRLAGTEGECEGFGYRVECASRGVYRHKLTLSLSEDEDESPVVESHVSMLSDSRDVTIATTYAMCKGAFFKYPQKLDGQQVSVSFDK